jgi:hypothetical protein
VRSRERLREMRESARERPNREGENVTGEFPVTEFGLREKKKMKLNKEHFTGKLRKHRN